MDNQACSLFLGVLVIISRKHLESICVDTCFDGIWFFQGVQFMTRLQDLLRGYIYIYIYIYLLRPHLIL